MRQQVRPARLEHGEQAGRAGEEGEEVARAGLCGHGRGLRFDSQSCKKTREPLKS